MSSSSKSTSELSNVMRKRRRATRTERARRRSIRRLEGRVWMWRWYSTEARARAESGKEKAHHAILNLFIALLNRNGLQASAMNINSDRKNSIFDVISKPPFIDSHATLATLGAAM